jgi:SAM-dependent methyltransferase
MTRSERFRYGLRGISKRFRQRKQCPCCSSTASETVDRKLPYTLERCSACKVLFRFPCETAEEMDLYYQAAYRQDGLTTDLPSDTELVALMRCNFSGTAKDCSRTIGLFQALGAGPGARVLDFGANWGYGAFQFQVAGYSTGAYELSKSRAAYGAKLGVNITTELAQVGGDFDIVHSAHVLEHVPNPRATLIDQLARTRVGGYVVGFTPNGSISRMTSDWSGFHRHWGLVHPVLLSDVFVVSNFKAVFVSSCVEPDSIRSWNRKESVARRTEGSELLLIVAKTK